MTAGYLSRTTPVHSARAKQSIVCNAGSPNLCSDTAARLIADILLIAEHDKLELEKHTQTQKRHRSVELVTVQKKREVCREHRNGRDGRKADNNGCLLQLTLAGKRSALRFFIFF